MTLFLFFSANVTKCLLYFVTIRDTVFKCLAYFYLWNEQNHFWWKNIGPCCVQNRKINWTCISSVNYTNIHKYGFNNFSFLLILSVCDPPCEVCTLEDTCRHCDDFHYGPNCENTCSSGCVSGSCDEVTGNCSDCSVGYSGEQCQLKCKQKFSHLRPRLVDFPLFYFFKINISYWDKKLVFVNKRLNIFILTYLSFQASWKVNLSKTFYFERFTSYSVLVMMCELGWDTLCHVFLLIL